VRVAAMTLRDLEDALDCLENAGRRTLWEWVREWVMPWRK
jgi:hypothetical protein